MVVVDIARFNMTKVNVRFMFVLRWGLVVEVCHDKLGCRDYERPARLSETRLLALQSLLSFLYDRHGVSRFGLRFSVIA